MVVKRRSAALLETADDFSNFRMISLGGLWPLRRVQFTELTTLQALPKA